MTGDEERDLSGIPQEGQGPEAQGEGAGGEEGQERLEDPRELTGFGRGSGAGPPWFDRKKALMIAFAGLSAAIFAALVFNGGKAKGKGADAPSGYAATVPSRELARLMELSQESRPPGPAISDPASEEGGGLAEDAAAFQDEFGLPLVTLNEPARAAPYAAPAAYPQSPAQAPPAPSPSGSAERQPQPQLSPLVPAVEGSLFRGASAAQASQAQSPPAAAFNPMDYLSALPGSAAPDLSGLASLASSLPGPPAADSPYAVQNDQAGKQSFYSSASGGSVAGGFLQESMLWIGTVIPAVLETAINTDLPGNVIARVTQNVYDSLTGKNILVPQGTLLVAQYNSSVSYAQRRVQIVWDVLIRPDGYTVELEGMNGVDPQGMAGLKAAYRENWFEYVKAMGVISTFSLVNAKMAEQVANYAGNEMAAGVITSNAEFVKDLGGNFVTRALNIQPTLTVENGERINVMLNKNIYLPPFRNFEVSQKYTLP